MAYHCELEVRPETAFFSVHLGPSEVSLDTVSLTFIDKRPPDTHEFRVCAGYDYLSADSLEVFDGLVEGKDLSRTNDCFGSAKGRRYRA
jgi:hypothetical protein